MLGGDLGDLGTSFIATAECMAAPGWKQMVVDSSLDDVVRTEAFTGLPTSMPAPAIRAAGLDPAALDEQVRPAVSAVHGIPTVAELVARLQREYDQACAEGP